MSRADRITQTLADAFTLEHLEVRDESGGHNVPAGSESHFKVILVCQSFAGQSRIARHRAVNDALAEEFAGGMHALAVHPYTLEEWRERMQDAPLSPPCAGGSSQ